MTTDAIDRPIPSLLYDDEQDSLRSVVRQLLHEKASWSTVAKQLDQVRPFDAELWERLATIGVAGLLVPEAFGGAGAGAVEMAVALEELGRAIAPVPTLTSAVAATVTLSALLDEDASASVATLLSEMATGTIVAAPVVRFSALLADPWTRQFHHTSRGRVNGELDAVVGVNGAHQLLIPGWRNEVPVLLLVEAGAPGVEVATRPSMDMTRPVSKVFLVEAEAVVIAAGEAAQAALRAGLLWATALLASEQLGNAERALEVTCEHLRTRFQFGRALGSYQSLRHGAAALWTDLTGARAVARYAAACLAEGDAEADLAAHLAQAVCSETALDTVEQCLQMMGGVGFTWEHPMHLHLKRGAATLGLLGAPERHRQQIGLMRGLAPA